MKFQPFRVVSNINMWFKTNSYYFNKFLDEIKLNYSGIIFLRYLEFFWCFYFIFKLRVNDFHRFHFLGYVHFLQFPLPLVVFVASSFAYFVLLFHCNHRQPQDFLSPTIALNILSVFWVITVTVQRVLDITTRPTTLKPRYRYLP